MTTAEGRVTTTGGTNDDHKAERMTTTGGPSDNHRGGERTQGESQPRGEEGYHDPRGVGGWRSLAHI